MTNFFRSNHGPVFAPVDAVGGGTSPAASLTAVGGDPQVEAMFQQGMAQQKAQYIQGMQQEQQKNELQTQGDSALKTLKAISIS